MIRVASAIELGSPHVSALAEYWNRKRGARSMPARADIDPTEIPRLLPCLGLAQIESDPFRVRYTLVGTKIVESAGFDYTGYYLDELDFEGEADTDWLAVYRDLAEGRQPIYGRCQYRTVAGPVEQYVVALFPLSGNDFDVDRCLAIEDWPIDGRQNQRLAAVPPTPRVSRRR